MGRRSGISEPGHQDSPSMFHLTLRGPLTLSPRLDPHFSHTLLFLTPKPPTAFPWRTPGQRGSNKAPSFGQPQEEEEEAERRRRRGRRGQLGTPGSLLGTGSPGWNAPASAEMSELGQVPLAAARSRPALPRGPTPPSGTATGRRDPWGRRRGGGRSGTRAKCGCGAELENWLGGTQGRRPVTAQRPARGLLT